MKKIFYLLLLVLLMPIMVFLDNIHINPLPFKYLVKWHAARYGKKYKNSKYLGKYGTYLY